MPQQSKEPKLPDTLIPDSMKAAAESDTSDTTQPQEPSLYEKLTAPIDPGTEAFAAKHPIMGPAVRMLSSAGGAVMSFPETVYQGMRHPIESAKSIGSSLNAYNPFNPNHITARGAMSVLPEAIGQGIGNTAAGEASGAMMRAAPEMATRAVKAPGEFALKHPAGATMTGGAIGAGAGLMLGERGGMAGEGFGGLGGAYYGFKAADAFTRAAEEKAINDVIEGRRAPESIPSRLFPRLRTEMNARAQFLSERASERGETPETIEVPSGIKRTVENMYEERSRMTPRDPFRIVSPEEAADEARAAEKIEKATERSHSMASLRGMQHAAGEAEREWVPSKRGVTTGVMRSLRIKPRLPR